MPRNVYNVRYLPRFGWTPVVLAPRDVGGATDPDALALVAPDTPILRARSLEPHHFRGVVSWLRRMTRMPRRDQGARLTRGIVRQVGGTAGVQRQPTGERRTRACTSAAVATASAACLPGQPGGLAAIRSHSRHSSVQGLPIRRRLFNLRSRHPPSCGRNNQAPHGRSLGGRVPRPVAWQSGHARDRGTRPLASSPYAGPAGAVDRSVR